VIRRRVEAGAHAVRELGAALREGPFRAALVASAAVHLALYLALGPGAAPRDDGAAVRLMRVRLLRAAAPAPPAAEPAPARAAPPGVTASPETPAPETPAGAPVVPVEEPGAAGPVGPAVEADVPEEAAHPTPPAPPPAPASTPDPAPEPAPSRTAALPAPAVESAPAVPPPSAPAASPSSEGDRPPRAATGPAGVEPAPVGEALRAAVAAVVPEPAPPVPPPPDAAVLADLRRRIDARKVYPQLAVRNGWEGRVTVEMQVDGDGRLADLRLLEGSGYDILDRATLAAVRRAAPFPPIGAPVVVPVEYRLTQ